MPTLKYCRYAKQMEMTVNSGIHTLVCLVLIYRGNSKLRV